MIGVTYSPNASPASNSRNLHTPCTLTPGPARKWIGIHSTALGATQFAQWTTSAKPGSLVWSPFSNLWLYGKTTDVATAQSNKPIQLSEQGQANPEESQRIRKSLVDLPAIEVKTIEDTPHRVAFLPHAMVVGWISDKELLIVENHLLVAYNVRSGARRKSTIHVEDTTHVFLR